MDAHKITAEMCSAQTDSTHWSIGPPPMTRAAETTEPAGATSKLLRHMVFGYRSVRTLVPLVHVQIHWSTPMLPRATAAPATPPSGP